MSTFFDSGHAKNAFNLDKLNQIIATFGASYNPANAAISLASLTLLHTNANTRINAVHQALNDWKNATNDREIAFQDLAKFSTQLLGALESMAVAPQTIDDFKSLLRKMRGSAKLTKADAGIIANPPAVPEEDTGNSNSQQSYDNKVQHFSQMILLLQAEPLYVPNEIDFTLPKLQNKLANLASVNSAANASNAALKAARIGRNTFFYKSGTGLLSLVKAVKAYVKSLYGAASQQYAEVAEVRFYRVVPANKAN